MMKLDDCARYILIFLVVLVGAISHDSNQSSYNTCMRCYPQNGTYFNTTPFYQPEDCPPMKTFRRNEALSCLMKKTVYVMGNSVARQFAFGLLSLVSGNPIVSRERQKELCLKGPQNSDRICSCRFVERGVTVKYMYKNTLDGYFYNGHFPFYFTHNVAIDRTKPSLFRSSNSTFQKTIDNFRNGGLSFKGAGYMIGDNCDGYAHGDDTSGCLRDFFRGSTASDIFIFSLGFSYAGIDTDSDAPIDYKSWITHSAVKFWGYIQQWYKGQVIWLTTAPAHPKKGWKYMNPGITLVNNILWDIWKPHTSVRAWYVIDQNAVNGGRYHFYEDDIHFQGNLTLASLYYILNVVCIPNAQALPKSAWRCKNTAHNLSY